MQRMKLHVSGVKLPKLGSVQDVVFRSYLVKEAELESKKVQFQMLTALTAARIDPSKVSEWQETLRKTWRSYLSAQLYVDFDEEESREEEQLKSFYSRVVSKLKLKLHRAKSGGLELTGLK